MKIYQLICYQYDMSSGNSETILETSLNGFQMNSIANRLNNKYGSAKNAEDYVTHFSVSIIDTTTVKDSLTRSEIDGLWN